jgi:hypothetical protein
LRKADDAAVETFNRLCHTIGPAVVRPLAIALAAEENNRAIRRLRELLLAFGAAGRQSVEQLKHSPNPAVRRMAIDLLRVFGGSEALPSSPRCSTMRIRRSSANQFARSYRSALMKRSRSPAGAGRRQRIARHHPAAADWPA